MKPAGSALRVSSFADAPDPRLMDDENITHTMHIHTLLRTLAALAVAPALLGADAAGGPSAKPVKTETAVVGGGCFWCLEAVYEKVEGVVDVESGYSGGATVKPDYASVCTGATGHAEVIRITYDPARIKYADLLAIFWDIHDPTTLNRQGADTGSQYRSVIFWADESQRTAAEASLKEAQTRFDNRVVTEIVPLKTYWKAEEYHQDYFRKHPDQPYCAVSIPPKLQKLFKKHADKTAKPTTTTPRPAAPKP